MLGRDTLTKKHFKALAAELRYHKPEHIENNTDGMLYERWLKIIEGIALVCASFNNEFDIDRFKDACGVDD